MQERIGTPPSSIPGASPTIANLVNILKANTHGR